MSFVNYLPIELSHCIFRLAYPYAVICTRVCKAWAKSVPDDPLVTAPIIYECITTGNVSLFDYMNTRPVSHDDNISIAVRKAISSDHTELLALTIDLKYGYKMWYMVARVVVEQCHKLSAKVPDVIERIPEHMSIKRSLWIIAARANNHYFIGRTLQLMRDDSREKTVLVETMIRASDVCGMQRVLDAFPGAVRSTRYFCALMAASMNNNHTEMNSWVQAHRNSFL